MWARHMDKKPAECECWGHEHSKGLPGYKARRGVRCQELECGARATVPLRNLASANTGTYSTAYFSRATLRNIRLFFAGHAGERHLQKKQRNNKRAGSETGGDRHEGVKGKRGTSKVSLARKEREEHKLNLEPWLPWPVGLDGKTEKRELLFSLYCLNVLQWACVIL